MQKLRETFEGTREMTRGSPPGYIGNFGGGKEAKPSKKRKRVANNNTGTEPSAGVEGVEDVERNHPKGGVGSEVKCPGKGYRKGTGRNGGGGGLRLKRIMRRNRVSDNRRGN